MQHPTTPRPHSPHTTELSATIWLPAADEPNPAPIPGAVLPAWAIDKIRTDYVGHAEDQPVPLFKIAVRDMAPGTDARIPTVRHTTPDNGQDTLFSPRIILAELHPDALPTPTASPVPAGGDMPGALDDGWPGFFHRTHRILPPTASSCSPPASAATPAASPTPSAPLSPPPAPPASATSST